MTGTIKKFQNKKGLALFLSLSIAFFVFHVGVRADPPASSWVNNSTPTIVHAKGMDTAEYASMTEDDPTCRTEKVITRPSRILPYQSQQTTTQCWYSSPIGLLSKADYYVWPTGNLAGKITNFSNGLIKSINHPSVLSIGTDSSWGLLYNPSITTTTNANGTISHALAGSSTYSLRINSASSPILLGASRRVSSLDGKWVVIPGYNSGKLYRVDVENQTVITFGQIAADTTGRFAISPDGRYVAVTHNLTQKLFVYDLNTCQLPGSYYVQSAYDSTCQRVEYSNLLTAQTVSLPLKISSVRFLGNDSFVFYDYNGPDATPRYDQYVVYAPGVNSSGARYLAMGDSFASGEGDDDAYEDGTDNGNNNNCHLATTSYPYLLNNELPFTDFHSVACSGAKTNNILGTGKFSTTSINTSWATNQFMMKPSSIYNTSDLGGWLPGYNAQKNYINVMNPSVITLGIGGNDMGFGEKVRKCIGTGDCFSSYEDRYELVTEIYNQYDKLVKTYQEAKRTAAPGTKIYVTGYPYLADTSGVVGCGNNILLSLNELKVANQIVTELNSTIEQAADFAGVRYVDVSTALDGYRWCERLDSLTAVNGATKGDDTFLGQIGNESFHPNQLGHQLLKSKIKAETANLTAAMPSPNSASTKPVINTSDPFFAIAAESRPIRKTSLNATKENQRVNLTESFTENIDGGQHSLRTNTNYTVELHSTPTALGTFQSDDIGNLELSPTIPDTIDPGIHTLHIFGKDIDNKDIDIYRTINIGYSATDFDGDGIADDVDECNLPLANEDLDEDGVDDACDPVIGDPILLEEDDEEDEDQPITYSPREQIAVKQNNDIFWVREEYETTA